MSPIGTSRRPAVAARRLGYLVAVLVNAALLYAVNAWPGWAAAPFLTADTRLVLPLVNASIAVSLLANVAYLAFDPPWFRALGDVATTAVGLVAALRIWEVFPFDVAGGSFDWTLALRVLLGVAIVGSVIGIVAGVISFVVKVANRSG